MGLYEMLENWMASGHTDATSDIEMPNGEREGNSADICWECGEM